MPQHPTDTYARCRLCLMVFLLAILAVACATPSTTQVGTPSPALTPDAERAAELHEDIVQVPLIARGKQEAMLVTTVFRPAGAGPFPVIVLSHGSPPSARDRPKIGRYRRLVQIRAFVQRGFAVIVPVRRGYGATGGSYAEGFGRCEAPDFTAAGVQAGMDVVASVDYARTLPYVDAQRVLLVGHSAGGFASLAAASMHPMGVIGVVNFSGGRGGDPVNRPGEPCRPDRMETTIGRFAQTITVPVLWHYTENDKFFSPQYVRAWFRAFEHGGAQGRLVMQPPFGNDGHALFTSERGLAIWTVEFDKFLIEIGLQQG